MCRRGVWVVHWSMLDTGHLGGISVFRRKRAARNLLDAIQKDAEYPKHGRMVKIPFSDRTWK